MRLAMDEFFDTVNAEHMGQAAALLTGRASYDGFSHYWPPIEHAPVDPSDRRVDAHNRAISHGWNTLPVAVVSDSWEVPADNPLAGSTTRLRGEEVRDWIEGVDGDVLVFASHVLWNALLAEGLVDELRLMVTPDVLGDGSPAFLRPAPDLELAGVRTAEGSANVLLTYVPVR